MSTCELAEKAKAYKELQAMIHQLEEEADAIKAAITAQMEAAGAETVQADVFNIRWQTVTSERLDGKALKAAMPELARQFTKTATARRFQIA
jgi:predicted phage-related endonuclease